MGFDIQRFPNGIDEELICKLIVFIDRQRKRTPQLLDSLKVRSVAVFFKILSKFPAVNTPFVK
jgi:hypothetical protein